MEVEMVASRMLRMALAAAVATALGACSGDDSSTITPTDVATDRGSVTDGGIDDNPSMDAGDTSPPDDVVVGDSGPGDSGPGDSGPGDSGPTCAAPMMMCGSACVSTVDNPQHCGSCGNVCGGATPFCMGT